MGRIIAQVAVHNAFQPDTKLEFSALVDTGASHLTLPMAWKDRFGDFLSDEEVTMEMADQSERTGRVCGPVMVQLDGFRSVSTEALFIDMQPGDGEQYEPLVGYLVLEASQAAVDMLGHRLVKVKSLDLK